MYSLNQVIYFLEQRQQTEDWNIRDAAIAYLKGYKEMVDSFTGVVVQYKEFFKMIIDEAENENAR